MANEKHLAVLRQGVEFWNQWRNDHNDILPDLSEADLSNANLGGANLIEADLSNTDLRRANLSGATLSGAVISGADLIEADLSNTDLDGANLREAILSEATLIHATLSNADLTHADISYANLTHADISNADLSEANLFSANLSNANLSGATLNGATLSDADLSSANLSSATLDRVDLSKADLSKADLSKAYLIHTDLSNANLGGTNFSEAGMRYTRLIDVDLSAVKGLETVRHYGPSTIGIDTIYKSKGNILHKFLLDAGVPKDAVDYLLPLAGKAIYYHSCFISYSSKDDLLARRLYNDLQAQGVPVFYAPEDLKIGAETRQDIDRAIHLQEKLLLILSRHSIESTWVQKEVETAFEKERILRQQQKNKATVLFPISIDSAVIETDYAWAADIRRMRNIGDFTKWKDHDAYQKAFDRLLRDLKAEAS